MEPLLEDMGHCIRELRVIIDNAKPSVLQFFGFGQAVEALLERSVSSAPSPLSYELVENDSAVIDMLPPNTVVALYRIVQEAVNNTVRHARAHSIRVLLGHHDGQVRVVIEDDGLGSSNTVGRRTGGLSNMSTRASLIRAEFKATAGDKGKGTRLELMLPTAPTQTKETAP